MEKALKKSKFARACWLLFLLSWLAVMWPVAIVMFFVGLLGEYFAAKWMAIGMVLAGLSSMAVAVSTAVDSFMTSTGFISSYVFEGLLFIVSLAVTYNNVMEYIYRMRFSRYMEILKEKRRMTVYELAAAVGQSDLEKLKVDLVRMSATMLLPGKTYDRENQIIDLDVEAEEAIKAKQKAYAFVCSSCGGSNQGFTADGYVYCEYCDSLYTVS